MLLAKVTTPNTLCKITNELTKFSYEGLEAIIQYYESLDHDVFVDAGAINMEFSEYDSVRDLYDTLLGATSTQPFSDQEDWDDKDMLREISRTPEFTHDFSNYSLLSNGHVLCW